MNAVVDHYRDRIDRANLRYFLTGFIRQEEHHGFCCQALALINAVRWHGHDTPELSGDFWMKILSLAHCRARDSTEEEVQAVEEFLGVRRRRIELTPEAVQKNLPAMVYLQNQYDYVHVGLIVGHIDGVYYIANYRGHLGSEVVSERRWESIKFMPGHGYAHQVLEVRHGEEEHVEASS